MDFSYVGFLVISLLAAIDFTTAIASLCPRLTLPNGRVRLRSRGRTVQFRCGRGFTRIGAKMAICLKSKQWSQKVPLCVGSGCPKPFFPPTMTVNELHGGGLLYFTCASGYTRQGPERIYCNGKDWNLEPPTCSEGISLGCDFEQEGLCGWSQAVESDNLDWVRHKGPTATRGTGPKTDHTLETPEGHYLFMEASAPSKRGHTVQLVSPKYNPEDVLGICMEFFYHMFGSDKSGDVGVLEVLIKPDNVHMNQLKTHDDSISLFEMDGNQGDLWIRQEIDIPIMDEPFQFVFEAKKQNSWLSDIALDDIRLYNCTNSTTTIITSPTVKPDTIPTTTTTTTTTTTAAPTTTRRITTTTRRSTTTPTRPPTTTTTSTTTASTRPPTTTTTSTTTTTTTRKPSTTTTTTTTPTPTTRTTTTTTTQQPTTTRRTTKTLTGKINKNISTSRVGKSTSTPAQKFGTKGTSPPRDDWARRSTTKMATNWPRQKTTPSVMIHKITSKIPVFHHVPDVTTGQSETPPTPSSSLPSMADTTQNLSQELSTRTNTGNSDLTTNGKVSVGKSQEKPNSSSTSSQKLIPLIAGVAAAVLLVAIVVAVLAYKWSKKQRDKEEKEMDDQMNIISDYVETSLSRS